VYNIAIWLSIIALIPIFFYSNLSLTLGYRFFFSFVFISYEICVSRVDLFSAHGLEAGGCC